TLGNSTANAIDASGTVGAATLAFTGSGAVGFTGSGARTLTLTGTNTGDNSLAAAIGDGTGGATSITKTGAGTWVLGGTSGYSGVTTISAGALRAASFADVNTASSIGKGSVAGSAADLILNGGTLQYTGSTAQSSNRLFT